MTVDRQVIPRPRPGYKLAELEGESMLYHGAEGKALYLNETASMIWRLCDGTRSVGAIEGLIGDAYPDAPQLSADIDDAMRLLIEHGAVDIQ